MKVKKIQRLDEGYVRLRMAMKKDVDTYMLTLIQQHAHTLSCIQEKRSSLQFLYDVKGYLSLEQVLRIWVFNKVEAIQFLIRLFTILEDVEESLPLYVDVQHIYVSEDLTFFKTIVLPIHEHINDENDWCVFLKFVLDHMKICDDTSVLGYLYGIYRKQVNSAKQIMRDLQQFSVGKSFIWPWVKRARDQKMKEQNYIVLKRELDQQRLLQHAVQHYEVHSDESYEKKPVSGDTIALFTNDVLTMYLEDEKGKKFPLLNTTLIGRKKECDLCIAHNTISLQHARIFWKDQKLWLQDLGSSNGTSVNGVAIHKLEDVCIQPQDKISFAEYEFVLFEESGG